MLEQILNYGQFYKLTYLPYSCTYRLDMWTTDAQDGDITFFVSESLDGAVIQAAEWLAEQEKAAAERDGR